MAPIGAALLAQVRVAMLSQVAPPYWTWPGEGGAVGGGVGGACVVGGAVVGAVTGARVAGGAEGGGRVDWDACTGGEYDEDARVVEVGWTVDARSAADDARAI
ncbi:MAG TPA: hypothetical protein VLL25_06945 [Acidimicrobiales bacterium]|nr:hypothetical protein [Acidimicrobiales bacterium]